jgi:hypothetical protein
MKRLKLCLLFILTLVLGTLPVAVFAHGTEDEHQRELFLNQFITYGLAISALLAAFFIILWLLTNSKLNKINVRKKEGRIQRDKLQQKVKIFKWISVISIIALVLSGGLSLFQNADETPSVFFPDIHGLGYTKDGKKIYVPAHDGLKVYSDGQWVAPKSEKNDYMGFSMVDDGFYSSGHPGRDSNMKNPFGVVKSTDGGKTLNVLDEELYGKMDFHLMDVGYKSHAIYLFNPQPNAKMNETGLFYTMDETKTWNQGKMEGLNGQPISLAVHLTEKSTVAVGTQDGVYLSKDFGESFENIINNVQATALSFDNQGNLLIGGLGNEVVLLHFNIESKEKIQMNIPSLTEDAISYIAKNPTDKESIVFTTFKKDIYLTNNNGQTWSEIADEGKGVSQNNNEK